jgi:hypothetical protein
MKTAPPPGWSHLKDNSALDFPTRPEERGMNTWTKGIVAGLVAGVVSLGSLPAAAGPYGSNLNRVEIEQEQRIHQGLHSGRLTYGEFRRLENQQARIRATEARMRADGRLTRGEKTQLAQMQAQADQNIYRYKHNSYRSVNHRPDRWRAGWR